MKKTAPYWYRRYRSAARPHCKFVGVNRFNSKKKFFETERAAKTWVHLKIIEHDRHGTEADISTELRVIALRCQKRLQPFGKTIEDAADYLAALLEERERSCTIPQLFAELSALKRSVGCGRDHVYRIELLGKRLDEMFPGKLVSEFTPRNIDEFLAALPGKAPKTRNTQRTLLAIAFCYANKHGYCSKNPAVDAQRAKEIEKPIGILRSDECAKLLAVASPEILPALAIAAFAGLRISEVCKLDWRDIHLRREADTKKGTFGSIEVLAKNAKSPWHRHVPIEPNLAAWLRPFAKPSGRVTVTQQKFNYTRRKAAREAGVEWPNNGLRHSYASYHYAHFEDPGRLQVAMGHTSPRLILQHYREVVRPDIAADYWKIEPSQLGRSNILAFKPEAYWWHHKVGSLAEGEWIKGVENFARYFGLSFTTGAYRWFGEPEAPQLREDDLFHIPTWRAFLEKKHPRLKIVTESIHYVSWRPSPGADEQRKYFTTEPEAKKWADDRNRELLAKELHLENITNVIEFFAGPQGLARECSGED